MSNEPLNLSQIKSFLKKYYNQDLKEEDEAAYLYAFSKTDKLTLITWLVMAYQDGYKAGQSSVQ